MPKWQYVADLPVAPPHFPPPETCIALRADAATKSGARVIERFETPTDEFGIPNPYETLRLLASTLDASYQLPSATNVHHQVHYRREYAETIEREFRESPSLMMNISVQMHNLDHALLNRAPKPALRVMEQYVLEQRSVSALFRLGSAAIRNQRIADTLSGRLEQATYTEKRQLMR